MLLFIVPLLVLLCESKLLGGKGDFFAFKQPNGQVFAVGRNRYGQLGLGFTQTSVYFPARMLETNNVSDISSGMSHTCVVQQRGQTLCVGLNTYGQLGTGSNAQATVLTQVSGLERGVSEVFCGEYATCAKTTAGAAQCWGYNAESNLGLVGGGGTITSPSPSPISGFESSGVQSIALGLHHTCFLNTRGQLLCVGKNQYGQLGDGTYATRYRPVTVALATGTWLTSISCGFAHTCATTTLGQVLCWGDNSFGQLGVGSSGGSSAVPVYVMGFDLGGAQTVWLGSQNTFILTAPNGGIRSFGGNGCAQLGNANLIDQNTPVVFAKGATGFVEVRGGASTTCTINVAGEVQCLGQNSFGQLGVGSSIWDSFSLKKMLGLPAAPSPKPTSALPTNQPTNWPTAKSTKTPSIAKPSITAGPTVRITARPTVRITVKPTVRTTVKPTVRITAKPTARKTTAKPVARKATAKPTKRPTRT
ncbi:hypothetical protein BASA81_006332 [Batrachochytrium salamandrivorans]|nr:hypothetical protein BASA81_006332 [Batrachochytrium salamandrivorans]